MKANFNSTLANFNTDDITDDLRNLMQQKYLSNPDYNFEKVNRSSLACGPLVKWCTAQLMYAEMLRKVDPLRNELRALEEAAKLRGQLLAAEREKKDAVENGKKSVDELTVKIKFLEKQRNELLQGFKKQMELIDVLKRQKLHLEAAHVLKYTEEEFMQTLDWKPNGAPPVLQTSSAGN